MDKSETYIRMCEKVTEIQRLIPFQYQERLHGDFDHWEGSWFALRYFTPTAVVLFHFDNDERRWVFGDYFSHEVAEKGFIWLPRQDELQDILFAENLMNGDIGYPLFCLSQFENAGGHNAQTMEQLWLAFVMWKEFGKRWTGEDWLTAESANSQYPPSSPTPQAPS